MRLLCFSDGISGAVYKLSERGVQCFGKPYFLAHYAFRGTEEYDELDTIRLCLNDLPQTLFDSVDAAISAYKQFKADKDYFLHCIKLGIGYDKEKYGWCLKQYQEMLEIKDEADKAIERRRGCPTRHMSIEEILYSYGKNKRYYPYR